MAVKIAGLFDIDDTLLETMQLHARYWAEATLELTKKPLPEEFFPKYAGKGGLHFAEEVCKNNSYDEPMRLLNLKDEIAKEGLKKDKISLKCYAKESLEYFSESGRAFALVTSDRYESTIVKLEASGIIGIVGKRPIITASIEGIKEKPDPMPYSLAAKMLEVDITDCYAFEDTHAGIISANSAGALCFGIRSTYSKDHDFRKAIEVDSLKTAISIVNMIEDSRKN